MGRTCLLNEMWLVAGAGWLGWGVAPAVAAQTSANTQRNGVGIGRRRARHISEISSKGSFSTREETLLCTPNTTQRRKGAKKQGKTREVDQAFGHQTVTAPIPV